MDIGTATNRKHSIFSSKKLRWKENMDLYKDQFHIRHHKELTKLRTWWCRIGTVSGTIIWHCVINQVLGCTNLTLTIRMFLFEQTSTSCLGILVLTHPSTRQCCIFMYLSFSGDNAIASVFFWMWRSCYAYFMFC
jgi:hypothetical protein